MTIRIGVLSIIFGLISFYSTAQKNVDWKTPFEQKENYSATYQEAITYYESLASNYSEITIQPFGATDSGHPLHEVVLSKDGINNPELIKEKGKSILFINNGIHAGEPCGIDASMMLARDILQKEELNKVLDNAVIVIIPVYNIGGAINRNSTTRTNQNGPQAYGFRGNAKNLDLNRDFIKCDSKNAQSFNQLFQKWKPDVFVDTHTSNGADYTYTMTLIASQAQKMSPVQASYMKDKVLPFLYKNMKEENYEMTPYVYARETPDKGIAGFLDLPRYSSGYTNLFQTLSFITEAHMLKPFEDRVKGTYTFLKLISQFTAKNTEKIIQKKKAAMAYEKQKDNYAINWILNTEKNDSILFKGYTAKRKKSTISGLDRLYYDQSQAFEKQIPFYNYYQSTTLVNKPTAYIIPQAYTKVIDRLKWNGIELHRLEKDTLIEIELYRIKDYKSPQAPYEAHYLHRDIEVEKEKQNWNYFKGDYIIPTNQPGIKYILTTLEPESPDGFFAWNFFDGILMQKEYFSAYVFEDLAAEYLKEEPALREELEAAKKEDKELAKSARAQLDFIYKRTDHYEKTHQVYPVGRIIN